MKSPICTYVFITYILLHGNYSVLKPHYLNIILRILMHILSLISHACATFHKTDPVLN